jgi:PPOX class probable F420-dependent enzyme
MAQLPPEVRALIAGRNIAHLATVLPDGSPHSVAVWIGVEGERAFFFTQDHTRKARNLARDPRVAVSVTERGNAYESGWLHGRVAETRTGEAALPLIDALSVKYTGEPFPMRSGTVFLIEAERAGHMNLGFSEPQ